MLCSQNNLTYYKCNFSPYVLGCLVLILQLILIEQNCPFSSNTCEVYQNAKFCGGEQCHLFCDLLIALYQAVLVSSVEDLPNCCIAAMTNETLPLEAACATETAACTPAPLLS